MKKSIEELKNEYEELMKKYRAAKERGDYEAALEFFEAAQKVIEDKLDDPMKVR